MFTITFVIFLFFIPIAWFIWTSLSIKTGKIDKPKWKVPLAILMAMLLGSIAVNYYLSNTYQLAFFQNGFESTVALIIAGVLLVMMLFVNIIVSFFFKGASKSVHNPKAVWIVGGVLCTTMLFFTMWVYPFAEKVSYIQKVEKALDVAEQRQEGEEITVVFMSSEKNCVRTNTSNCRSVSYKNTFFLKNNLDVQKEVQVQIRALDVEEKELEVVESDIMTLEAGELKLLETEESSDESSIWSRHSFETDVRTHSYESIYRYRDAE